MEKTLQEVQELVRNVESSFRAGKSAAVGAGGRASLAQLARC
jgi:hypothetical protein